MRKEYILTGMEEYLHTIYTHIPLNIQDGKWEEVHTETYEPLDEGGPDDEIEGEAEIHEDIPHTRKEKGKGRA